MKILITGTSGLLGLNLSLAACSTHDVTGVDRSQLTGVPFHMVKVDLLIPGVVEAVIDQTRPDWLVHCAALANLEACEADPDTALRLNAHLPAELARVCAIRGIRMVHLSTDAVFDGARDPALGPYTETDTPHPISIYSDTKYKGEQGVQQANPDAIVARVNFYGFSLSGKRSLAEFFVNNLSQGKRVNGFTDVIFCPMHVHDLGDLLLKILEKGLGGLYHVVGGEAMTKYEFGLAIARRFGFDETLITPASVEQGELKARRAHNLYLSVHKISTALGETIPSFSTGLERFYAQFQQGYPQKIRTYTQVSPVFNV
jgi:dTDP-4-dehydrorhamnose reductase